MIIPLLSSVKFNIFPYVLLILQMVMAFEDEFAVEIPDAEADKILTVAAAIDYIAGHPQAK